MQSNRLLVLVDIDGTLITAGLTPRRSLTKAIFDITGHDVTFEVGQLAGLTDPLIIRNALERLGIPTHTDSLPEKILDRYLEILVRDYPAATDKRVFPGVFDLLEFLKAQPVRMGLLTGNIRRGAQVKLRPFDLEKYFDFGVFGSDSADPSETGLSFSRNELPRIALDRVKSLFGEIYRPEQVVVIGDTLNDVTCAHVNQMQSLIVLRREEWREQIETAQPELLVESFEPIEPVKNWFEEYLDKINMIDD